MKRDGARPQATPRFFSPRDCRGWSLLELVVVLVVAAVLVLFAVRTFQPKEALALEQAERLRNDLRHAQMLALTWGVPLRVTTGANSYQVCCADAAMTACVPAIPAPVAPCTPPPNPVTDPATGKPFLINLEPGLTLAPAGFALNFDSLGRPRNGAALAGITTFTINGATVARTVIVAPITGFASAQ